MINYDSPELNVSLGNDFLDGLIQQSIEIARENGEYVDTRDIDIFDNFNNS